jgi:PknH-like extracellular domain
MFTKPSTRTRTRTRTRTTIRFAAVAGLAVTMLGMTACTAQLAAPPTGTGSTTPAAARTIQATHTVQTTQATRTAPSAPSAPPQSWLAPAQLPFGSALHWTGGADSSALSGAAVLSQEPIIYPCMNHGYQTVAESASAFKTNSFTGNGTAGSDQSAGATQSYFTYSSAAAAQSAFKAVKQDLPECSGLSAVISISNRPMTGTETDTASTADAFAYTYILRDDQGQPARENGNYSTSDYHTYVAVNGATVEILWLAGGPAIDDASYDAAVLQALVGTLN